MKTLDMYLNEQLKSDEFRKEWEDNQPEMDVIRAIKFWRVSYKNYIVDLWNLC